MAILHKQMLGLVRFATWIFAMCAMVALAAPVQATAGTTLGTCAVAPRPASEFVLPTDPAVAGGSPLIADDESELPFGTPATPADVAAVQSFADLYTSCQNAGDLRRLAALYTDVWFQDTLATRMSIRVSSGNPLEDLIGFLRGSAAKDRAEEAAWLAQDVASPPTPRSLPIASVAVQGVRMLPDGRLAAILVQDGRPTEFHIYVRGDSRLLLDQRIDLRFSPLKEAEDAPEVSE